MISSVDSPLPSSPSAAEDSKEKSRGRSIDPNPVLSLLLEPRSLVITTKALYTDHLHSIESVDKDFFTASDARDGDSTNDNKARIANIDMLRDERIIKTVKEGGVLERGTRVSLTCRDVERVVGGNLKMKGFGRG